MERERAAEGRLAPFLPYLVAAAAVAAAFAARTALAPLLEQRAPFLGVVGQASRHENAALVRNLHRRPAIFERHGKHHLAAPDDRIDVVDVAAHELLDGDGMLVDLTDGEFSVLRAFVERPRRVLARDALLEAARGPDTDAFDRAIDVQVSRLRRKLRSRGDEIIRTIRNEGYFFVPRVIRL